MKKLMIIAALLMLAGAAAGCIADPAAAQVSVGVGIGISLPTINIGISIPFPELVVVPGYPVYYAPQAEANLFFYDGFYWVFRNDTWYASSWYNGPWATVDMFAVPAFILRIPVRYYRYPPVYFSGWQRDASPRWGDHWGHEWQQRRGGWDRWDGRYTAIAPIPTYQRQYSGDRYPRVEHQTTIINNNYSYQPREPVVQQHRQQVQEAHPVQGRSQQQPGRAPVVQRTGADQRSAPVVQPARQSQPEVVKPEQVAPRSQGGQGRPEQVAPRAPQQTPAVITPSVAPRPEQAAPRSQGPPQQRDQAPGASPQQPPGHPDQPHGQPAHAPEHGQSQEKGHGQSQEKDPGR